MKKVTIKDVASKTGLAVSTVSRVLNNTGYVSQKTRRKVMKTVEELNYIPDPTARGLVSGNTHMLSIVVPMIRTDFYDRMINSIDEYISEKAYDTVIFPLLSQKRLERFSDRDAFLYRTDGIIMASMPIHKLFPNSEIPTDRNIVLVDMYSERYDCMYLDNVEVGRKAAEVLYEHTDNLKMLTFIEPESVFTTNVFGDRVRGFSGYLADNGIKTVEKQLFHTEIDLHSAYTTALKLLETVEKFPVGIFATCDLFGYGLTLAAKNKDLEIGKDLFIVGVDNQPWAEEIDLTTIKQPVEEMSEYAAKILIEKIEAKTEIIRHESVKFESTLIRRGSA
ncbi:MAG TPA: LacI family DNA-binding transcriptional regulator [Thermotogota bacterium]|nr:LacI family DNA-binding transcriptional regulator [Thermotogota bacterium]HPJ89937.1 LacI family DNA-binding transcriptional regulator [Thermotogota bacterium]HPR96636.1 LacI family DNA-binding transcriptional regulator [Thermotogota bacterium]